VETMLKFVTKILTPKTAIFVQKTHKNPFFYPFSYFSIAEKHPKKV